MSDLFREAVENILLFHREGRPLGNCSDCQSVHWPHYRSHIADLITAEREVADRRENRSIADFPRILAEHAPYASPNIRGVQCPTCLDGHGGGEYPDTETWAQHVADKIAQARMRVVRRG